MWGRIQIFGSAPGTALEAGAGWDQDVWTIGTGFWLPIFLFILPATFVAW